MIKLCGHRRTLAVTGVVLFFVCLGGQSLFGQVDTGTLLGTVKDQTGAVIPGAQVTLTNESTSFTLTTTTGADGAYVFTPIKIGRYTVEAEFKGFQKPRRTGIDVSIQSQIVVDFVLVPGAVTQTVEVTGQAPLLQTQ